MHHLILKILHIFGLKKMYVVKNNSGNGNEGQEQNIKRPPAEFDIMLPSVEMKLTNLGNGGVDQKKNGNGNLNNIKYC